MDYENMMSIIVSCSDDTLDVFDNYLKLFNKYWNDCPFKLYLVTPTKHYSAKNVISISMGENSKWVERIVDCLKYTDSKYVLTMCEDAFISNKIKNKDLFEILEFMQKSKARYYCNPKYSIKRNKNNAVSYNNRSLKIRKNKPYSITCFTNIWDRDELIRLNNEGIKTGWDVENYFLGIAAKSGKEYYENYYTDSENFLNVIESVNHGLWTREMKKFFKNENSLDSSGRNFIPYSIVIRKKIHKFMNHLIPSKMRRGVKKIASRLGYKFVTEN